MSKNDDFHFNPTWAKIPISSIPSAYIVGISYPFVIKALIWISIFKSLHNSLSLSLSLSLSVRMSCIARRVHFEPEK